MFSIIYTQFSSYWNELTIKVTINERLLSDSNAKKLKNCTMGLDMFLAAPLFGTVASLKQLQQLSGALKANLKVLNYTTLRTSELNHLIDRFYFIFICSYLFCSLIRSSVNYFI